MVKLNRSLSEKDVIMSSLSLIQANFKDSETQTDLNIK